MKPSRKKHLCRICHITLATFLSVYVSAQNIQKGGWQDFGITQEDTVIHINCTDLSTNNRSHLFYADFRHSFEISFSACFRTSLFPHPPIRQTTISRTKKLLKYFLITIPLSCVYIYSYEYNIFINSLQYTAF